MYEAKLISVEMKKLKPNPLSCNCMSKNKFNRLVDNICKLGFYKPVIVRAVGEDDYEILDGYYRVKALLKLGYKKVQAVIWDVDDVRTAIFLASLNRLCGSDNPLKKTELLRNLTNNMSEAKLSRLLPLTQKQIQKLTCNEIPAIKGVTGECNKVDMPESAYFFMKPQQKKILDSAMSIALKNCTSRTKAQKNSEAIIRICSDYIGNSKNCKRSIFDGK